MRELVAYDDDAVLVCVYARLYVIQCGIDPARDNWPVALRSRARTLGVFAFRHSRSGGSVAGPTGQACNRVPEPRATFRGASLAPGSLEYLCQACIGLNQLMARQDQI